MTNRRDPPPKHAFPGFRMTTASLIFWSLLAAELTLEADREGVTITPLNGPI